MGPTLEDKSATTVGLVVLTTGDRPSDLTSIMNAAAELPFDARIVVGNGAPAPLHDEWRSINSSDNLGVPGGRSFGLHNCTTDVVVFLDDDSTLPHQSGLVDAVRRAFDSDPAIGAVAFRVVVTGTDTTLRRWSPTPSTAARSALSDVPTFPGNGHALRRAAFEDVDGYLDELFFKHEETELTWRLLDAGWRVVTDPTIVVGHPETSEARHERALELGLRNKIWISRLRLPVVLAVTSSLISVGRALGRCRSRRDLAAAAAGLRAGMQAMPTERKPIRWSTVQRLTRSGRPPIF